MSRELRNVPKDWKHPKNDSTGNYLPLYDRYNEALKEFSEKINKDGLQEAIEYFSGGPLVDDYMPVFAEADYFMMYETCSEGTPISPAFKTIEELAHWLADNEASAFGEMTATYEQWLSTCKATWVISGLYTPEKGLISGVEGMAK